jgi:RNA polymerase sigma-70 factor, ECF subfamily
MNEESAIELCIKHKDPSGFEHLVKCYRREAMGHALGIMGNPDDALEMCQESFKRAFLAMPKLQKLEQFYPWFYSILRNCCFNALARKKTTYKHAGKLKIDAEYSRSEPTPVSQLEREEAHAQVWEVLQKLSPEHREILSMKYFNDMKYQEIAQALQIPRGTVMSRLYCARKSFAGKYDGNTGEGVEKDG